MNFDDEYLLVSAVIRPGDLFYLTTLRKHSVHSVQTSEGFMFFDKRVIFLLLAVVNGDYVILHEKGIFSISINNMSNFGIIVRIINSTNNF